MLSDPIFFPGLESIPSLTPQLDHNGDPVFLKVVGNCPIVICAPHSGTPASTPAGAKIFGKRQKDPVTKKEPTIADDTNTLKIALAIVRNLSAMGFIPHAVINLVSRSYMDLNRPWEGQVMWGDGSAQYHPGDENKSARKFPQVEQFRRFKRTYYQKFHDRIRDITTSLNPNGWLFDIHGRGFTGGDLILFSGYGYYARQDFVYGSDVSLHHYLRKGDFSVIPSKSDPAKEVRDKDGKPTVDYICGRYGARYFDPSSDPIPFPGNVVPSQPRRVHGIQFEIEKALRIGQSDEFLESVGINLAYAIFNCLHNNGLLVRSPSTSSAHGAHEWYTQLG